MMAPAAPPEIDPMIAAIKAARADPWAQPPAKPRAKPVTAPSAPKATAASNAREASIAVRRDWICSGVRRRPVLASGGAKRLWNDSPISQEANPAINPAVRARAQTRTGRNCRPVASPPASDALGGGSAANCDMDSSRPLITPDAGTLPERCGTGTRRHHPRRPLPAASLHKPGLKSIGVGTDDLSVALGPHGPPRLHVDAVLNEPGAAVGHRHVGAAGVVARDIGVLAVVGAAAYATEPAGRPFPLIGVRGHDGLEEPDSR